MKNKKIETLGLIINIILTALFTITIFLYTLDIKFAKIYTYE